MPQPYRRRAMETPLSPGQELASEAIAPEIARQIPYSAREQDEPSEHSPLPLHLAVWRAIDRVAQMSMVSNSRLAIESGLDLSALNKSKRSHDGLRFPTFLTLARIAETGGLTMGDFVAIYENELETAIAELAAAPPSILEFRR
jgi:hypothetical protein